MKKLIALMLAVLFFAPILTAPMSWSAPDKLVIVTPIGSNLTDPVVESFKLWYQSKTGRSVEVSAIRGGTPALFARIKAWAGNPEGDLFWGGSPDMYDDLGKTGLLVGHLSSEASALPSEFGKGIRLKEASGKWYVLSFFGLGVIFNDQILTQKNLPKPKTWDELLDPRYRGLISFTTAGKSGTMHNLVELFLQRKGVDEGWAYWRTLAANLGKWAGRSFDVFTAVKTGEAGIGVAQAEDFAVTAKSDGLPMSFSYMDMNTMVLSPIAILKGAPNEAVAKLFVDYVLTKEGQVKMTEAGFVPSRPDVKFSDVKAQKAQLLREVLGADTVWDLKDKFQPLDFSLNSQRFSDVNKVFDETIFQPWDQLKQAWFKIEEAQTTINSFRAKGAQMAKSLEELSKAVKAFKNGDYSAATRSAQTAVSLASPEFQEQQALQQQQVQLTLIGAGVAGAIVVAVAWYMVRKRKAVQ